LDEIKAVAPEEEHRRLRVRLREVPRIHGHAVRDVDVGLGEADALHIKRLRGDRRFWIQHILLADGDGGAGRKQETSTNEQDGVSH
jgi:hypothetical protein